VDKRVYTHYQNLDNPYCIIVCKEGKNPIHLVGVSMSAPILEMKQIVKEFPGVKALKNVSFTVMEGEVHCLVGENGAGKSTLMKVLSGVYPYGNYEGQIFLNGQEQKFSGVRDSEKAGIGIIYQELALVPELSVYENIFIGNEIQRNGIVDWNETIRRADEVEQVLTLHLI